MSEKYPAAGDIYRSKIYPQQVCHVVDVLNALVTFDWQGQYKHVATQSAPVNKFVRDFEHEIGQ
jgi:hypothetical protein